MNYLDDIAERIKERVPPCVLPDHDTRDLFRIYAVLALGLGPRVQVSDVHNGWVAWMLTLRPDHPSLRPFMELPPDLQRQDEPFVDAIRRVAADLGISGPAM